MLQPLTISAARATAATTSLRVDIVWPAGLPADRSSVVIAYFLLTEPIGDGRSVPAFRDKLCCHQLAASYVVDQQWYGEFGVFQQCRIDLYPRQVFRLAAQVECTCGPVRSRPHVDSCCCRRRRYQRGDPPGRGLLVREWAARDRGCPTSRGRHRQRSHAGQLHRRDEAPAKPRLQHTSDEPLTLQRQ